MPQGVHDGDDASGPQVSVVVPVFNVQAYLSHCIDSVLRQTLGAFELILVDDGSTDASGAICDQYAAKHSNIKVLHQPNSGTAVARNAGMAMATGPRIAFLDADDWLSTHFLESMTRLMDDSGADIAVSSFTKTEGEEPDPGAGDCIVTAHTNEEALRLLLGPKNVLMTVPWGKVIERRLLEGIEFPQGRFHEDEFTTYRILARAQKIVITTQELYFYRQHPGSFMASRPSVSRRRDELAAYRARAEFFKDIGMMPEAGITYRRLFNEYIKFRRVAALNADKDLHQSLSRELRLLAKEMRGTRQRVRFRVFCEAYQLAPRVMDAVYSAYAGAVARHRR